MPVLPFHRYIGPGNPSNNGPPIDEDDRIAKQHDHNYDRARTEADVRTADLQAITSFRRNWLFEGNWHSLIGDLGLSIKYLIESYTGVIYPDLQEMANETDECRIMVVNHFLKLHCVFKRKHLLEKYKINYFLSWDDRLQLPKIFCSFYEQDFESLIPPFLYVPLNWSEIYSSSQLNPIVLNELEETFGLALIKKNASKDGLKIITKYFEWMFVINRKTVDEGDRRNERTNILALIHSGYIFIDQDGNLHSENVF